MPTGHFLLSREHTTYLEREALALDDAELAKVVPVVGGVDDVRVVQLPHLGQLAVQLRERKGGNEGGIHSTQGMLIEAQKDEAREVARSTCEAGLLEDVNVPMEECT